MHCAAHILVAEGCDHALDLAPVAEAQDIARVTGALRACARFERGLVPVALHEVGSVGKRCAAMDEWNVHAAAYLRAVAGLSTTIVNRPLTIILRLPHGLPLWHGAAMPTRSTRAGGCFLTIFILAGFILGLAIANPMKGVLIGTGTGAALALLIWLIDRRR